MKSKLILCLALTASNLCFAEIIYPKALDAGSEVISNDVKRLLKITPHIFGNLHLDDLTITNPWPVYTVERTNLAAGELLSAAKSNGWQYFFMHGTNAVAAARVVANGNVLQFDGFTYESPSYAGAALEAARTSEKLQQVQNHDYEFRYLDAPWFPFSAVWLHGKSDDILIPLPDVAVKRWSAFKPCSESEIINLLKPEAEKKALPAIFTD